MTGIRETASPAMKIVLFGVTGMLGQGVLRECLRADDVAQMLAIGRSRWTGAIPGCARSSAPACSTTRTSMPC